MTTDIFNGYLKKLVRHNKDKAFYEIIEGAAYLTPMDFGGYITAADSRPNGYYTVTGAPYAGDTTRHDSIIAAGRPQSDTMAITLSDSIDWHTLNSCASDEQVRYYLCGVHITPTYAEATDGTRAIRQTLATTGTHKESIIIPSSVLAHIKKDNKNLVFVAISGDFVDVRLKCGTTLAVKPINATYPNTQRIYNDAHDKNTTNAGQFIPAEINDYAKKLKKHPACPPDPALDFSNSTINNELGLIPAATSCYTPPWPIMFAANALKNLKDLPYAALMAEEKKDSNVLFLAHGAYSVLIMPMRRDKILTTNRK